MNQFDVSQVRKYVDGLSLQQRIVVLILMFLSILLIWVLLVYMPLQNRSNLLQDNKQEYKRRALVLEQQLQSLKKLQEDRVHQESLQGKNMQSDLLEPVAVTAKLPKLLESVLEKQDNLELISLSNNLVRVKQDPKNKNSFVVDKNILVLKFTGDYFAIAQYLKTLEKLKLKIYWNKLSYRVIKYPIAAVTLEINVFQKA